MKRTDAVLFDCYNTLVLDDWLPPPIWEHLNNQGYKCSEALQSIFQPDGFDGTFTPKWEEKPGHANWYQENMRTLLRLSGVSEQKLERVLQLVTEKQASFRSKPAPGVIELIGLLRSQGYKIGICSNWEEPIEPFLCRTGVPPEMFDAVVTSAEVGARKPNSKIFLEACDRLGVPPYRTVHIGDNWRADVGGALRSGLSAVWLSMNRPSQGVMHLVPEFDSLAEIMAIHTDSGGATCGMYREARACE